MIGYGYCAPSVHGKGKSSRKIGLGRSVIGMAVDAYQYGGQWTAGGIIDQAGDQGEAFGIIAGDGGIRREEVFVLLPIAPFRQRGDVGRKGYGKIDGPGSPSSRSRIGDHHRISSFCGNGCGRDGGRKVSAVHIGGRYRGVVEQDG